MPGEGPGHWPGAACKAYQRPGKAGSAGIAPPPKRLRRSPQGAEASGPAEPVPRLLLDGAAAALPQPANECLPDLPVLRRLILLLALLGSVFPAWALTPEQAGAIAAGDSDDRVKALNAVVATADPALEAFVKALLDDAVKTAGGKAYIVQGGKAVEAASGAAAALPADAEDAVNNNRMRRELESAIAVLRLVSPDRSVRAAAITDLKDQVDEGKLGLIEKAEATEADPELKA